MEHRASASDGTIIIDTAALIPRETPELRLLGDVGGDAPGFVPRQQVGRAVRRSDMGSPEWNLR
jgi:hypothetical protein